MLQIDDNGSDNIISIPDSVREASTGTITLNGHANRVVLEEGVTLRNARLLLGHACRLEVGAGSRLASLELTAIDKGTVLIGEHTNFTWHTRLFLHEPGLISVGARCLIASETMIMVSDMHSIIDRDTGLRINPAADVHIEDDVWLAHQATVMKGCTIGQGSIIAFGSVVSRDIPAFSLAAGRPASVIKSNVSWNAALI